MSIVNNIDITCYEGVIAPSRTPCACYPDNPYTDADSDKYLDELEGLANIKQALQSEDSCDYVDIYDQMQTSIDNAIHLFIQDTNRKLMVDNTLRRQAFKGAVGMRNFRTNLNVTTTYAGVRICCADIVDGVLKVNGIGTLFQDTGIVNIEVWNNLNERVAVISDLSTLAGRFVDNQLGSLSFELPMHSKYTPNLEYYFVYAVDDANLPKDNKLHCGCGGLRTDFNTRSPYWGSQTKQTMGWTKFAMIGSFQLTTDDLATYNYEDDLGTTTSNYMNGLVLDIEFKCNPNGLICRDGLDYTEDPLALAKAEAIRFKAGFLLVNWIKSSGDVNYDTLINLNEVGAMATYYDNEYQKLIEEIVKGTDKTRSDCFGCRDTNQITKGSIFR